MSLLAVPILLVCLAAGPLVEPFPHVQPRPTSEAEFEQIATLLRLREGSVAADMGAGSGSWTFRLAARVGPAGRVFATDVKKVQVDGIARAARARGFLNVTTILGSQTDVGLPERSCDALLLRLVYHAFDEAPPMRDGMRRALKVGGLVLVIDFRPDPDRLTEDMRSSGFERVQLIERWQDRPDVDAVLFRKSGDD
jgi:ubiquinone/menaquinone biosynthesis C-methylase UbiE